MHKQKGVNWMTVAEVPPASTVSFDKKKRSVNRMTMAEVPPASGVSFDKKKRNNTIQSTGRLWRRCLRPVPA